MLKETNSMGSSPVGVQEKTTQVARRNLKHAGLLSIKAANDWIIPCLCHYSVGKYCPSG